ncbi:hypothetical protein [Pedobacter sp.]
MIRHKQPWLNSAWKDSIFILTPPFFCLLLIAILPKAFIANEQFSAIHWLLLVVFIDVAHVYSTLYRTYFNRKNFNNNLTLLTLIPIGCYLSGFTLYQINSLWFWRILAYLAVFHFIRQQYGFMKLYNRTRKSSRTNQFIDAAAIYAATLYPIIYWHLKGDRNFNWFISGDFIIYVNDSLLTFVQGCYVLILAMYFVKEIALSVNLKELNIPKNVLLLGTILSWYVSIIYFNGDLVFTLFNVVSHGIPYMALIWFIEKKRESSPNLNTKFQQFAFGKYGILIFIAIILALAYVEEALWDGMIWKEHQQFFKIFSFLPTVNDQFLLSLLIPLLALPQATHYVLDGFIWKKKYNF